MAYTDYIHLSSTELTALRDELLTAKTKLVKGGLVASAQIDGDQVTYTRASMADLNAAIGDVQEALSYAENGSSTSLTSFSMTYGGKTL